MTEQPQPLRTRIPADIEREDRVLGRLTARQVAILAVTGVLLWLLYLGTDEVLPAPVFLGVAAPIAVAALVLAFGSRDGVTVDRLAWAALRQASQPRRLVPPGEDGTVPAPPAWTVRAELPGPLRLPARAIGDDGSVDLGSDGVAAVLSCSTVSFALATAAEQEALVAGFGSWLNSLSGPAQAVVGNEPVSLAPLAARLDDAAGGLPHPALEEAAREHATYLRRMNASTELRARRVLLVVREPTREQTQRRADDAMRALRGCRITARILTGSEVVRALAECSDPYGPPPVGTATGWVRLRRELT